MSFCLEYNVDKNENQKKQKEKNEHGADAVTLCPEGDQNEHAREWRMTEQTEGKQLEQKEKKTDWRI